MCKDILSRHLDEFPVLGARTLNIFHAYGMKTIGDIIDKDERDLLRLKNFGRLSLMRVCRLLDSIKEDVDAHKNVCQKKKDFVKQFILNYGDSTHFNIEIVVDRAIKYYDYIENYFEQEGT